MSMEATESTTEPTTEAETTGTSAGQARAAGSPLRKLTDEQELELTRLYSGGETSVPQLARRFGVGESSVYRIVQKHGAALRGRRPEAGAAPKAGAAGPGGRSAAGSRAGQVRGGSGAGRQQRSAAPTAADTGAGTPAGGVRRFRVVFVAEVVVEAATIREAIAKAEGLGATDVTSVSQLE